VRTAPKLALLISILLAAGMWLYVSRVLVPHQKADAVSRGDPRGNLSDLYPSWLGSRELLLRGIDPYSPEITRQIQAGYYGRPIDSTRKDDPTNQQAFAYPVYVAFVLAPTVKLPFSEVQGGFRWLLAGLTALSVFWWLRALGWQPSRTIAATLLAMTFASFPVVQGIKLQQLSLAVAALIAGGIVLLVSDCLGWAGILLALAMIKPQLTVPVASWLLLWAFSSLRERWRFVASFVITMAALIGGGDYLLPGWIGKFRIAIAAYRNYNDSHSLLDELITPAFGLPLAILIVAAVAVACWRGRKGRAEDDRFRWTTSLVLAVTLVIIPMFAPHYQLLLLPGAFLLLRSWEVLWKKNVAIRFLLAIAAVLVSWAWISAMALAFASFFTPAAQHFWQLPLWTSVMIPLPIAACLGLIVYKMQSSGDPSLTAGPPTG
jgi:hypothetical protein